MASRLLVFGGFDPLSSGWAAARARSHLLSAGGGAGSVLGIVTSKDAETPVVTRWRARAANSGFRAEAISLEAPDARARLLRADLLHFPAGHTAHLLHVLRPLAPDLRRAWEEGLTLSGASGGGLCWFSHCWSSSRFGEPEWVPGLAFLAEAATAHHDQSGYRRPSAPPPNLSAPPSILALDNDSLLDCRAGVRESIAIRPGAAVHILDSRGRVTRTLPGRDLSPWVARLIRTVRTVRRMTRT